jgi:uncharacterized membrane protein
MEMQHPGSKEHLVNWYLDELERGLRVKDRAYREQILAQVKPAVMETANRSTSKKDLVREMGSPKEMARELSDPRNWVVDIGSPLSPRKEIAPFFSPRGRYILTTMFLMGIAIPILLFIFKPDVGWVLPGLLLSFVAVWAIGVSFLNNYLGYLGTAWDLKGSNMNISTIGIRKLRVHLTIYTTTSITISLVLGSASVILDNRLLSVAVPITFSTIAAAIISARMIDKEGKRVLG